MSHTPFQRATWLLLAGTWPGCIASNVVATQDRAVVCDAADLAFEPVGSVVLEGLYESIDIRGEAAVSLRKVYYLFAADGTYTAAALTEVDGVPSFQTLNGVWDSTSAGLALDGRAPVLLERAPEHLRLTAPKGVLVLRRGTLQ
ncbi:MAG: hypothetical protein ABIP94_14265 [Planctomycetota bacterium]